MPLVAEEGTRPFPHCCIMRWERRVFVVRMSVARKEGRRKEGRRQSKTVVAV
jgi:hypothetical protein